MSLLIDLKRAAFLEGEFVTRAGKSTNYYIDKYQFLTKPHLLGPLSEAIAALFPNPDTYDRIAAPELGAVPLASVVSIMLQKPFIIVKKGSKGYGTDKLIEGEFAVGERVVILEDILTTAGAALRAHDVVKAAGLITTTIVGVIDRLEGAAENIAAAGLTYSALYTRDSFLNS